MGLELDYIDGQTPLEDEEKEGLLIKSITNHGELNEFEQQNIEDAIQWTMQRSFKKEQILGEQFIKALHKRMYGHVWAWAGEFRKTNKNIGIDCWQISVELRKLLKDTLYWTDNKSYAPEEIAVKFKHRLVSIHCFPNGNGRHSRLMADIIIEKIFNRPLFSWGRANLSDESNARTNYIKAVKAADKGDYSLLLSFARS
jgi:Fic-DOC domain mobile mystery protein B